MKEMTLGPAVGRGAHEHGRALPPGRNKRLHVKCDEEKKAVATSPESGLKPLRKVNADGGRNALPLFPDHPAAAAG